MAAPSKKKTSPSVRKLNGSTVTPVLYNGRAVGHGKYLTGETNGQIITDSQGYPLPLKLIGELIRTDT